MPKMADPVRWFDALGSCRSCGKAANGKLMGPRNESHGAYCTRCATSRLTKARTEQQEEEARLPRVPFISPFGLTDFDLAEF